MNGTDIFEAIRAGDHEAFKRGLAAGQGELVNICVQTPLHEAIVQQQNAMARLLIDAGVNVNAQDEEGRTALHFAAAHGGLEILGTLLDGGADVRVVDRYGNGPLWTAVLHPQRDAEIVRRLLRGGADPHAVNAKGRSPIEFARTTGNAELLALLAGSVS